MITTTKKWQKRLGASRFGSIASAVLMLIGVGACGPSIVIPDVPLSEPVLSETNRDVVNRPIKAEIGDVVFAVPATEVLAEYSSAFVCRSPYSKLYRTDLQRNGIYSRWRQAGPAVLSAAGFVTKGEDVALPKADQLTIDAWITDLKIMLCREKNFWTGRTDGESGEAYIEVRWQATDRSGQVVYREITEAGSVLEDPSRYGRVALATAAFDSALSLFAHSLLEHQKGFDPAMSAAAERAMDDAIWQSLGPQSATGANSSATPMPMPARPRVTVEPLGETALVDGDVGATTAGQPALGDNTTASMPNLMSTDDDSTAQTQLDRVLPSHHPAFTGGINRHAGQLLSALVKVDTIDGPKLGVVIDATDHNTADRKATIIVPVTGFHQQRGATTINSVIDTDGGHYPAAWNHGDQIRGKPPVFFSLKIKPSSQNPGVLPGVLPIAPEPPRIGDTVYAITLPVEGDSLEPAISRGIVSDRCAPRRFANGQTGPEQHFQADFPVSQQAMLNQDPNQRGGLILDASGNLLGLAVPDNSGDHAPQFVHYAASSGLVCFAPLTRQ